MLTLANVIWGARCGKSARRVLLGETRSSGHAYSVRGARESAALRQAPHGLTSSRLVSTIPLDLWFHEVVTWHTKGEACLIRYADDFVCAFENQDEAQHFFGVLEHRLEQFGLRLAKAKSRVIPFSRNGEPGATRFDFLGFEFYWGKDRSGKPHLKRRTSRKKLRNSLANFTQWCKENRSTPLRKLFPALNPKLRGYYQYYGVSGNSAGLQQFYHEAMAIL